MALTENNQVPKERQGVSALAALKTDREPKRIENQELINYLVFLYRVCKITKGQSSKSTLIERIHHLTLNQLRSLVSSFKPEAIRQTPEFPKISNFLKDAWRVFNISCHSSDLYFVSVCSHTK